MDNLKKERTPLRTAFTRTANLLDDELKKDDYSEVTVNALIRQLEDKFGRLSAVEDLILEKLRDDVSVSEDDYNAEFETAEAYRDRLSAIRAQVEKKSSSVATKDRNEDSQSVSGDAAALNSQRKYQLPKIEFKQFGGDIRDWLAFWSQFQKIHLDTEVAAEDKFQYLRQATVEGSKAREVVDSFPQSAENYPKAIAHIKSRFGNEDTLVEVYVRELLRLVLNNALNQRMKISLVSLYDKLEAQLRALETLGVTTDKFASILYPLVESSLPEDVLRAWERSKVTTVISASADGTAGTSNRLSNLMTFLRGEVDGEERISLARAGFGLSESKGKFSKKLKEESEANVPTAAGLFSGSQSSFKKSHTCIFCEKEHESSMCFQARKLSLEEKRKIIQEKKVCFVCLNKGHMSKFCKAKIQCQVCLKRHYTILCGELPAHNVSNKKKEEDTVPKSSDKVLANQMCSADVSLQTLMVRVVMGSQEKLVRAIIDTGSQRTYVSAALVNSLNMKEVGQEKIVHSLFGGVESKEQLHHLFEIRVCNLERSYYCRFKALDQPLICGTIPRVRMGSWMAELSKEVVLSDVGERSPEVQLLIGSDIAGKLFTGKKYQMSNGLVALETHLGWTLLGKIPENNLRKNNVLISLLSTESSISDLWKLETIGIMDSAVKKNKLECQQSAMDHFNVTVRREGDGRVEVSLPWIEGHPPLKENRLLAEKRLISMSKKLNEENRLDYQKIFDKWEEDQIIERVPVDELNNFGHYLPHRPVFNPTSKTTPVRPCYDASAKEKNSVSLNDCLEKGLNLVELITAILSRFRIYRYGAMSDIEKAFLQIGLRLKDRDFLRFLWWEKEDPEKIAVYRHRRVVFGVSSSPFLLGATLNHILDDAPKCLQTTAIKLKSSLYVDNCIASFNSKEEVSTFVKESVDLLSAAKFNLRGWIFSKDIETPGESSYPVLGLVWNLLNDTLSCDMSSISEYKCQVITKRSILSAAHRVFDPIGFTTPLLLCPKLFLQELWKEKIGWDEPLPDGITKKFASWVKQLSVLSELKIPRWFEGTDRIKEKWTLHTFCDASKLAFATCVFIRIEKEEKVVVHLIQAKARVAPISGVTIPRLELLACVIGARLASSVKEDLGLEDIPCFYWTDSMNALFWIKNDDAWGTFVWNRVNEIRALSRTEDWRHVPGVKNPADLPSRGCSATQLVESKWWEGPNWLKDATDVWLLGEDVVCDQDVINSEKKKTVVSSLAGRKVVSTKWISDLSSEYTKILRIVALIRRFIRGFKKRVAEKKEGSSSSKETGKFECLSASEINDAEKIVVKVIQMESFKKGDSCISNLQAFEDSDGMLRVKTRILNRDDNEDFKSPFVLPSHHALVDMLIKSKHEELSHCGVQVLMSSLREKFWIIKSRRTIRSVIGKCVTCKRFQSSPISSVPTALPKERVSDAAVFQVTGVDLTGPLFLKNGQKCWIVLFTCAFYRAIHLELVVSLSTEAFLQALRRFVSRRGRPSVIYSDNGTNFVGAENLFKGLDWKKIESVAGVQRIDWKFIPPSSPWWGGWWERLIGLVKSLLRRVLGRARLEYEDLLTILCDAENVVNSRPLTYVSEDVNDLVPITPMMFLQDMKVSDVPDLDVMDADGLNRKYRYRQKLREDLSSRFRKEYLSQLVHQRRGKGEKTDIGVGDIVYVGSDNSKRLNWPLGRVMEVFPGKDGHVRVARVKTSSGTVTRPVQRLYHLEVSSCQRDELSEKCETPQESESDVCYVTRFGRRVKKPDKINLINFIS